MKRLDSRAAEQTELQSLMNSNDDDDDEFDDDRLGPLDSGELTKPAVGHSNEGSERVPAACASNSPPPPISRLPAVSAAAPPNLARRQLTAVTGGSSAATKTSSIASGLGGSSPERRGLQGRKLGYAGSHNHRPHCHSADPAPPCPPWQVPVEPSECQLDDTTAFPTGSSSMMMPSSSSGSSSSFSSPGRAGRAAGPGSPGRSKGLQGRKMAYAGSVSVCLATAVPPMPFVNGTRRGSLPLVFYNETAAATAGHCAGVAGLRQRQGQGAAALPGPLRGHSVPAPVRCSTPRQRAPSPGWPLCSIHGVLSHRPVVCRLRRAARRGFAAAAERAGELSSLSDRIGPSLELLQSTLQARPPP